VLSGRVSVLTSKEGDLQVLAKPINYNTRPTIQCIKLCLKLPSIQSTSKEL